MVTSVVMKIASDGLRSSNTTHCLDSWDFSLWVGRGTHFSELRLCWWAKQGRGGCCGVWYGVENSYLPRRYHFIHGHARVITFSFWQKETWTKLPLLLLMWWSQTLEMNGSIWWAWHHFLFKFCTCLDWMDRENRKWLPHKLSVLPHPLDTVQGKQFLWKW